MVFLLVRELAGKLVEYLTSFEKLERIRIGGLLQSESTIKIDKKSLDNIFSKNNDPIKTFKSNNNEPIKTIKSNNNDPIKSNNNDPMKTFKESKAQNLPIPIIKENTLKFVESYYLYRDKDIVKEEIIGKDDKIDSFKENTKKNYEECDLLGFIEETPLKIPEKNENNLQEIDFSLKKSISPLKSEFSPDIPDIPDTQPQKPSKKVLYKGFDENEQSLISLSDLHQKPKEITKEFPFDTNKIFSIAAKYKSIPKIENIGLLSPLQMQLLEEIKKKN